VVIGGLQQACVEEREEETRENRGNEYVKGGVPFELLTLFTILVKLR
jgi:hypothetical protein